VLQRENAERIKERVGRRVAEVREERGWTQQECAERLDMPLKNLQRIEAGANLTLATLVRLANGLGIAVRELFDDPTTKKARPGRPRKSAATRA